MPTNKPNKPIEKFCVSVLKFSEMLANATQAEIFNTEKNSRGGTTKYKVFLKPIPSVGMAATKAAKFGKRMELLFPAFFTPTHYESYKKVTVSYVRGNGCFVVEGVI